MAAPRKGASSDLPCVSGAAVRIGKAKRHVMDHLTAVSVDMDDIGETLVQQGVEDGGFQLPEIRPAGYRSSD
jgi:hypothetical protein